MRPIELRFQCFGPYMEEQVIDFSRLAESGLFLICGETGAGKTAILDAMCCALYGRSSGGQRDGLEAMRCKLAGREDETVVDFIFAVGSRRYRFTRSLKYARKNLNDSHNCMELRDGQYVPLLANPKMREVDRQAERLLGLTYEQFCQVVILPQGQFERLLVSKSEEKEAILVSLFHAERWQRITEELKRRIDERDRALKAELTAMQNKLAEYDCKSLEALELLLSQRQEEAGALAVLHGEAAQAAKASRTAHTQALLADKEFRALQKLRKELDDLLAQVHSMDVEEKFLVQAGQAEVIAPLYETYRERAGAVTTAAKAVHDAAQATETARQILAGITSQQDAHISLRPQQEERLAALVRWQGALELYQKLDERTREAQSAYKDLQAAEQAAGQADQAYQSWDSAWQQAMADRDSAVSAYQKAQEESPLPQWREARPLYLSLEEEQEALRRAELDQTDAQEDFQQADGAFRQADARWRNAMNMQQGAMQRYQEAQSAYFQGIGGILAQELRPGTPCPVCGSTEHPAPAPADTISVTEETLKQYNNALAKWSQEVDETYEYRERAERAQKEAQTALETCKTAYTAAKTGYDALLQRMVPGIQTLAQLDRKIAAAQKALDARRQAVSDAEAHIQSAAEARTAADGQRQTAQAGLDACKIAYNTVKTSLEELTQSKIPGIETVRQLRERISALRQEADAYAQTEETLRARHLEADGNVKIAETALEGASMAQRAAEQALTEKQGNWQEALAQSGLDSEAQFLAARMDHGELERRKTALTTFRADLARAQTAWEEQQRRLAGQQAPRLEVLEQRANADEAQERETAKKLDLAQDALARTRQDRDSLSVRLAAHDIARQKTDADLAFAACLGGRSGVSLQRYVLGVMLTAITVEANRLLQNVHGGRYRLYRTDESAGRARKRGLELEILDAQNNERRSVTTLSGGEKFLVSLSLAIGLSTVVQAQGGGIRLEAMFIDEGFGSLDRGSIADAFDVLQGIQRSHGLVGIISHVEQLEETIQSKIEVHKDRRGSYLTVS